MAQQPESKEYIKEFAEDALRNFKSIAESAAAHLKATSKTTTDVFAYGNSWTSDAQDRNLDDISLDNMGSYERLMNQPAIARIEVDEGKAMPTVYYIYRTSPVTDIPNLASYLAPLGRLASLPIGNKLTLPKKTLTVVARALLWPSRNREGWDALCREVEAQNLGPLAIESLRSALEAGIQSLDSEDILEQILADESAAANIFDGRRRSFLTKMGLRDQPVLDQYQDEIFRLPLAKRLVILGPPGTGKTTTLIRRLGQKLNVHFLEDSEKALVEAADLSYESPHANSWLMFTPTKLLKEYLKEAFAREAVPASNRRIQTWSDYRHELARVELGILKTATGKGSLVLKEALPSIRRSVLEKSIQWFDEFNSAQRMAYVQELRDAAEKLASSNTREAANLGNRLKTVFDRPLGDKMVSTFRGLVAEISLAQNMASMAKEKTDQLIKDGLKDLLKKNRNLLAELAVFIDGLQQSQAIDAEDLDEGDDEEPVGQQTTNAVALNAYMQAVRAWARAVASGQHLNKSSKNAKILEWFGEANFANLDLNDIGNNLLVMSSARRFANPVKTYFDGIPKRYRAFRRACQERGQWYLKEGFESREVHPLELDAVILAILRDAFDLLSVPDVRRNIESPSWSTLIPIQGLYRNQIVVDEATDFSPIQLACMASLTNPGIQSFFACGDFNQRLTNWGTRTADEFKWIYPDFDFREISVSYRQSRQLNDLARAIVEAVGGSGHAATLPAHVDNEGVAPALLVSAHDRPEVVHWLSERICEIENFVGQMPSTAIFVKSEEEVTLLAAALHEALTEHNINVRACPLGQAVGQDNDVRIFDIQHIKGLEFEAVFFVDADDLDELHSELFDKYLYVGATRAATYLGITCNEYVPDLLEGLRSHFTTNWAATGAHEGKH